MFDFKLKNIILEPEEKTVLKNFDMLVEDNNQVSVSLPIINPCISVLLRQHTKCEGFLFWFVIPFNLKTGRKSLSTFNLAKTVIYNRLKIACSVLAITTGDVRLILSKVLNEFGISSYKLAYSYLGAVNVISRK